MRTNPFLRNIVLRYVAIAIAAFALLFILHVRFVQSSIIEQTDRTLVQDAGATAKLVSLMGARRAGEPEMKMELNALTNHEGDPFAIEVSDSSGAPFFRSSQFASLVSFAKFEPLANNEIRAEELDGGTVFRVVARRISGFTVVAGYPEPTFAGLAAKTLSEDRYIIGFFFLLTTITAAFVDVRFIQPVHKLNQHLKELQRQSFPAESAETTGPSNGSISGATETALAMVERFRSARTKALNFSSFASHELRTPMTIIRNQIEETLSSSPSPRALRKLVNSVYDETLRLNHVIESLLNLSTMQAGTVVLNIECISVQQFLKEFCDEARFLARPKNITVELRPGPELSFGCDVARIRQVLFNLLDNAVKNTPASHKIWLSYEQEQHHVLIKFSDSGIGIPPQLLPRIFELFVHGNETSRDNRGTGLGLALVNLIMTMHGGSVSVESKVGSGTTFFLRFPTARPTESIPAPGPLPGAFKTT